MPFKALLSLILAITLSFSATNVSAAGHSRAEWKDISNDKNFFNKNCDYKVWVLEDDKWSETWYLEAFDAENAFYTISRHSSSWSKTDTFYALNYQDKSKFLTGESFIKVVTFALCLTN